MRNSMRYIMAFALLLPVIQLPNSQIAVAGELPSRFKLAHLVPADVWLFMDFAENEENAWLEPEWDEVMQALAKSGIDRDLVTLITAVASQKADPAQQEAKTQETQATIEKVKQLFHNIEWSKMGKEAAFAMRMAEFPLPYDYFFMMRNDPESAASNADAIMALFSELASWTDDLMLSQADMGPIRTWTLGVNQKEVDVAAYFLHYKDVFGVVIGSKADFAEVLALMNRKEDVKSMATNSRFNAALEQVPAPEDGVVYFDGPILFNGLSKMMTAAVKFDKASPEDAAEANKIIRPIQKCFKMMDIMEYSITTVETDGRRQLSHEFTKLKADKLDSPLCRIVFDRKPFKKFDTFVPENATSFTVTGLIDIPGAYDTIVNFVKTEIEGGEAMIQEWDNTLAGVGFNPHEDVFSWWSGEMISVTLPPEVVTPMSSADWVLMLRVNDKQKADDKVNAAINFVNNMMSGGGQQGNPMAGQGLMITDADVQVEGFREITHPMMAMFIRPVIGVHDEWLIIGSSAGTINKCLDVAAGNAPSIASNPRFKEEGFKVDKPVHSASFTDTSNFGQELAAAVGMVGMFGGMATAQIPDPDAKEMMQTVLSMVMKMGPVLQKLDFYSSDSMVITREGDVVKTEYVVTYKRPEVLQAARDKKAGTN